MEGLHLRGGEVVREPALASHVAGGPAAKAEAAREAEVRSRGVRRPPDVRACLRGKNHSPGEDDTGTLEGELEATHKEGHRIRVREVRVGAVHFGARHRLALPGWELHDTGDGGPDTGGDTGGPLQGEEKGRESRARGDGRRGRNPRASGARGRRRRGCHRGGAGEAGGGGGRGGPAPSGSTRLRGTGLHDGHGRRCNEQGRRSRRGSRRGAARGASTAGGGRLRGRVLGLGLGLRRDLVRALGRAARRAALGHRGRGVGRPEGGRRGGCRCRGHHALGGGEGLRRGRAVVRRRDPVRRGYEGCRDELEGLVQGETGVGHVLELVEEGGRKVGVLEGVVEGVLDGGNVRVVGE